MTPRQDTTIASIRAAEGTVCDSRPDSYIFGSQKFFKLLSDNGVSTSGGFAAGFYAGFK